MSSFCCPAILLDRGLFDDWKLAESVHRQWMVQRGMLLLSGWNKITRSSSAWKQYRRPLVGRLEAPLQDSSLLQRWLALS
jgi:hypothetical protein